MSTASRVAIVLFLAAVGATVVVLKNQADHGKAEAPVATSTAGAVIADMPLTNAAAVPEQIARGQAAMPRLVDLGAGKCIPCKMMAPILEELKKEYADTFTVEFIDVWQNKEAGEKYGIRIIPTQIFYDADGKELFRHEGFFGKEDILDKWKEYGVAVQAMPGE